MYVCLSIFTVHPLVQVPNQLVGAPVLTDVTLICNVEASPKAINYWQRENGEYCWSMSHSCCSSCSLPFNSIALVAVRGEIQQFFNFPLCCQHRVGKTIFHFKCNLSLLTSCFSGLKQFLSVIRCCEVREWMFCQKLEILLSDMK